MKISLVFFLLYLCAPLSGQSTVEASASVEKMMNQMIYRGKATEEIKAWRAQIITTDNRREMETAMARFKAEYPDISIDWKHVSPYYQVRVGFFESKNKLMPFLLEVKEKFPSATPVFDSIKKRDLVDE